MGATPARRVARRYLVVLQAFFDDSGRGKESDSPVFVLAGYTGSKATFVSFANDWQAVLREEPTLEYVKGKEANSKRRIHCRASLRAGRKSSEMSD